MTKIFGLLLFFILNSLLGVSQTNLIIDGGFETLTEEKLNYYYTDLKYWTDPNNGYPKYSSELSSDNSFKPEGSILFYQKPKEGFAHVVLIVMQDPYPNQAGEYVQTNFIEELIIGKTYQVKFYVSLANGSGIAVSHLGAYLSKEPVSFAFRSNLIPQVESNQLLNDTLNWVEISGNYTSQGGEKYITIGNFKDDKASDTIHVIPNIHTNIGNSFYLIDDVSVICLDCPQVNVGINEQAKNKNTVLYNIEKNTLTPTSSGTLVLYNFLGNKIVEQKT